MNYDKSLECRFDSAQRPRGHRASVGEALEAVEMTATTKNLAPNLPK